MSRNQEDLRMSQIAWKRRLAPMIFRIESGEENVFTQEIISGFKNNIRDRHMALGDSDRAFGFWNPYGSHRGFKGFCAGGDSVGTRWNRLPVGGTLDH